MVNEILDEAKHYNSLSDFDKQQRREEQRRLAIERHVKDVAHNATMLNYFMRRSKFLKLEAMMFVLGLCLCVGNFSAAPLPIMLASGILFIKFLYGRFKYRNVKKLMKDDNIKHFCKVFRPALKRAKKGTKWLRPCQICAVIAKKGGKKISAKDMGISLTKICFKTHQKYLVKCI